MGRTSLYLGIRIRSLSNLEFGGPNIQMANGALKQAFEDVVERDADFSMAQLREVVWPQLEAVPRVGAVVNQLNEKLNQRGYRKLSQAILRAAFLIELVKVPKIETTKFRVRWCEQLQNDPRGCSFEECLDIAGDLMETLPAWLVDEHNLECLLLAFEASILPYEVPIDYEQRLTANGRIHQRTNIGWYCDELVLRTLKLRKYLTEPGVSPDADFFSRVLNDKIKVKTYLTDRVLTGAHKTNREKRWEAHPESVHFAMRRTCLAIEYALVTQICAFEGFPQNFAKQLRDNGIIPAELPTALCPITGDAMSYDEFRNELLNPTHGRSDFQVGHLNPLKLGDANGNTGHTAENISWISADGNRIQGSLSLGDVRELLQRIGENYGKHKWWSKH